MNEFLAEWGYLAVYVATTLEGEFAYLSAIVAGTLGQIKIGGVIIAAFFGGFTRDMAIFLTARYSGQTYFKRNPKSKEKIEKASNWISRRPVFLAFHRFVYGLSTATVVALGLSTISLGRFVLICATACLTWTLGYGALGYFAADQVLTNLTWLKEHFYIVILFFLGLGFTIFRLTQ
jgi:membrane protein DedA with SNARE-associated domain